MNPDTPEPEEEQWASWLAACDEALAAGGNPEGRDVAGPPPELRPQLERELVGVQRARQLLRCIPRDGVAGSAPLPALPQTNLGRFQIRRELGRGGCGVVFLAYDPLLGREVALKVPRAEVLLTPEARERFQREARAASTLDHPNLVPVHEAGAVGPVCFLVTAYCPGPTLAAWLKERAEPVPFRVAALLVAALADAAEHAHQRGVVHRDLKPSNVLLVPASGGGPGGERPPAEPGANRKKAPPAEPGASWVPRVTDFGLAKLMAEGTHTGQTRTGAVVGTVGYMAPEQASGKVREVGPAADIYALGAILYEVLTGRPPFRGETDLDTLQQVQAEEPVPPTRLRPKLTRDLETICVKCLRKEPSRRYGSAAALVEDLRHFLAGQPIRARPVGRGERAWRWCRRNPSLGGLVALLATGLAALVLGTVLLEQERFRTVAVQAQAAADKADAQARARKELETQLYYHRITLADRELAANNLNRAKQLLDDCPTGLRGWEWHCLKRLCHADLLTLRGHTDSVSGVAFSPDGLHLASASHDRTVLVWDLTPGIVLGVPRGEDPARTPSGRPVRTLTGHTDVVYGLAYSPDGDRLATASWDGTVKVWDAADGRELLAFRGHNEPVLRVAFSPGGRRLASLSAGTVKLWDASTGAELRTLGAPDGLNRYGLAYSPDGRYVAVTTQEPAVIIWEAETGRQVQVFRGHKSQVKNVAFSPDGRLLASGAGDLARSEPGEVMVWETANGREVFRLRVHTDSVSGVAFSPDGLHLASASHDRTVKVWEVSTGREAHTLRAHTDTVRAVAFSPDGYRLASACADGTIKVWDATPWVDDQPAR
jgi:WD40 repeat protein/serine/threonine protein kinase